MLERAQDQLSHAERLERAREAEAARRLRVRVSTAIGWSRGVRAARRELLRPVEIFEPAS